MKTLKTLILLTIVALSFSSCIEESDFEPSNQNPDEVILKDGTTNSDNTTTTTESDGDIGGNGGSGTDN